MEIEVFTVNSLGKDFGYYETRFPTAWERYIQAYQVIVEKGKESLLGGSLLCVTVPEGFLCCNHFYPGIHESMYDFYTDKSIDHGKVSSSIYPKFITDEMGYEKIVRYVDYEGYFRAISKVIRDAEELNNSHKMGIDKIKILWSVDGNLKIIKEINKEVLKLHKSKIKIEICLESQYWPESL